MAFTGVVATALLKLISIYYDRYSVYTAQDTVTNNFGTGALAFYVFVFICSTITLRLVRERDRELFKFYSVMYSFFIGLQIFFILNSAILNQGLVRLSLYFLWPCSFIIGMLLLGIKDKNLRVLFNIAVYAFLVVFFIYLTAHKGSEVIPFQMNPSFAIF